MEKEIRFYKRELRWFADLPDYIAAGGTEDDCEMVGGADEWLDILSNYTDTVRLKLCIDRALSERIILYEKDDAGGTYIAHTYKDQDINHVLWLCNVTLFVFGDFPHTIFYEKI